MKFSDYQVDGELEYFLGWYRDYALFLLGIWKQEDMNTITRISGKKHTVEPLLTDSSARRTLPIEDTNVQSRIGHFSIHILTSHQDTSPLRTAVVSPNGVLREVPLYFS
jgi:hypothetical protein